MKRPSGMKRAEAHEASFGHEARLRAHKVRRFASRARSAHFIAAQPLLHVCGANASFERVTIMRNDKLSVQSMDFAVAIIALVKDLKKQRENKAAPTPGRLF